MDDRGQVTDQLAVTRTHLANERTFAAWIRTGLAVSAAGFALDQTAAPTIRTKWFTVGISTAFVFLGGAMIVLGGVRYGRVSSNLARLGTPPVGLGRNVVFVTMALMAILLVLALKVLL